MRAPREPLASRSFAEWLALQIPLLILAAKCWRWVCFACVRSRKRRDQLLIWDRSAGAQAFDYRQCKLCGRKMIGTTCHTLRAGLALFRTDNLIH